ncbi:hypothetical protein [Pseudomonas sp. TCU-HL1]|uniref:hypothetical protein n=1 Tax=Pseudomonas sp. TCU-HL1 TaxID=1856685 RepID=UPI0011AB474A|nr:hypothetical protein [Pseudomonas sp. TCU-HL1]
MMIYEASGKPGDGMKLDTSVKWDVVHQGIYCLTITALTACTRDEALPIAGLAVAVVFGPGGSGQVGISVAEVGDRCGFIV